MNKKVLRVLISLVGLAMMVGGFLCAALNSGALALLGTALAVGGALMLIFSGDPKNGEIGL